MRKFTLFYSWQSEDNKSTRIIEAALTEVVTNLKESYGFDLAIDHSTLGKSGSPSIDQAILDKIDHCDIFLADITPVVNYQKTEGNGKQRTISVPNPNVLVELGYALSAVGTEYVVLAAHQAQSWSPHDLPFDINHRKVNVFNSSNCNLTNDILQVIDYIKEHGRHRHKAMPYLLAKLKTSVDRWKDQLQQRDNKRTLKVNYAHSTVFFSLRMAKAFPGRRGLVELTKKKEIRKSLDALLAQPLDFDKGEGDGIIDPIWFFRAGSAMHIDKYKHLGGRKFLVGWDELKISKIAAYIDTGRYYNEYVYIEAEADKPTGLYGNSIIKDRHGVAGEEYAVYKLFDFWPIKVSKPEEDDGYKEIFGRRIHLRRDRLETRIRPLTKYNIVLAAKQSAYNNHVFDRQSEDYLDGLLQGMVTVREFHDFMMTFQKPQD